MIAVLFEVTPRAGRTQDYLDIAHRLRSLLDDVEGFVSIERFESLTRPGTILSLSFWTSEAAVAEWRNRLEHRVAQEAGRAQLFADYRLRVASVVRDYGMHDRAGAPERRIESPVPGVPSG
jgi:heme-degrading monooxygenase HmoA